jgi:ABC-2 type transport system permease protein
VIFTIGLRELKSLFLSPLAWSILAVVRLILAYLFLGRIEIIQLYQAQLAAMDGAPGVTEIICPICSAMRRSSCCWWCRC